VPPEFRLLSKADRFPWILHGGLRVVLSAAISLLEIPQPPFLTTTFSSLPNGFPTSQPKKTPSISRLFSFPLGNSATTFLPASR
jgi:hypothetical protein